VADAASSAVDVGGEFGVEVRGDLEGVDEPGSAGGEVFDRFLECGDPCLPRGAFAVVGLAGGFGEQGASVRAEDSGGEEVQDGVEDEPFGDVEVLADAQDADDGDRSFADGWVICRASRFLAQGLVGPEP